MHDIHHRITKFPPEIVKLGKLDLVLLMNTSRDGKTTQGEITMRAVLLEDLDWGHGSDQKNNILRIHLFDYHLPKHKSAMFRHHE